MRGARALVRSPAIWAFGLAALVELALLIAWQRNGYWGFSGGVYADSSRELLHGLTPYRDFAAAQPPPVFLVGALLLAISDGPGALHVGLGLTDAATAGLVAYCVWRLERRAWLAIVAGLVAPLLPITLNSHAQLIPETLAAPLILAGAIGCASERHEGLGAALLAVAAWCKVAFLIPALAVAIAAPRARRTVGIVLGGFLLLYATSIAVFGTDVWRQTVVAQVQVGSAGLHYGGGLIAQIVWNELPLLFGAALLAESVRSQRRTGTGNADRLIVTLAGAAAGGLLLALTVFKVGSYLNVMVVAEPPLLVLAVSGVARSWQTLTKLRPLIVVAGALLAGQSISLLVSPGNPGLAVRPFAGSGLAWTASPASVGRAVAVARRCPAAVAYSGTPYIAFLARRRMPGNQPDLFMLANAREDANFAVQANHDEPRCPTLTNVGP